MSSSLIRRQLGTLSGLVAGLGPSQVHRQPPAPLRQAASWRQAARLSGPTGPAGLERSSRGSRNSDATIRPVRLRHRRQQPAQRNAEQSAAGVGAGGARLGRVPRSARAQHEQDHSQGRTSRHSRLPALWPLPFGQKHRLDRQQNRAPCLSNRRGLRPEWRLRPGCCTVSRRCRDYSIPLQGCAERHGEDSFNPA